MYILVRIGSSNINYELVSKTKKRLVEHLKNRGYYYSKKNLRYTNNSSTDYSIDKIDVL